jgi:hypothetical protein
MKYLRLPADEAVCLYQFDFGVQSKALQKTAL